MRKGLAILGSTGNIGVQALEVVSRNPKYFDIIILTAGNNAELLVKQAKEYKPKMVYLANSEKRQTLKQALNKENIHILESQEELFDSFHSKDIDLVFSALLGFAGLLPALKAIDAKKDIALANKESLVVGGHLLMNKARQNHIQIIPVDSEHSAIFQCLQGEDSSPIEKIILTASGGPFYDYSAEQLKNISLQQALKHPTWNMGRKITIDSASMMNKGLEVIEARFLFDLQAEQIEVIVHPESVIHSMVQFTDGSIKAQMGPPDMQSPIHYALYYPGRQASALKRLDFTKYPQLSFKAVDTKKFRNLALAYEAMKKGGNMPAILNAANEAAVEAVLNEQLPFHRISELVEQMMNLSDYIENPQWEDLLWTHRETMIKSKELISRI